MTPSLIERLDQTSIADGGQSNEQSGQKLSHAPGPWFYRTRGDGYIVRSKAAQGPIAGVNGVRPISEAEANARLIAAAPDLLKALTHCQRVLADLVGGDKSLSTINIYAQAVEAELKARAALASAKGSAQP